MRKARRALLLVVILLSIGGVGYKVSESLRREIKKNPLGILDHLPEAALHIKDFHRAKVEKGRKVWELFGDEAQYFKDKKEALIKKPRFYYYSKKDETLETSAHEARAYLTEKELERLELKGGVQVAMEGYALNSEEANYFPAKDQIILPTPTRIVGDGITVEGARMEVELESQKIRMVNGVKTKIEPAKMAAKKNKINPKVGG
jgi:LPS export ABC transporter protein LptC